MSAVETKVLREEWDVDRRLAELRLTREGLLKVVAVALAEAANATPLHPANAAGTFAYQHGSWSLRDQFAEPDWMMDRQDGVESILCDALKIRVAFCNVDVACSDDQIPKPRSRKGAGAERAAGSPGLFGAGALPHFAPPPKDGRALYYLMADENGAAELTRPYVRGGTFVGAIERLYLSFGGDGGAAMPIEDGGVADGFDPQIARK